MTGIPGRASRQPSRILFVITGLNWGGAESQVIDLAVLLRQRGWEVSVACMLPAAARRDALESQGVGVHTLGMARGKPDPRGLLRLLRLIRTFRPHIVHAHMVHAVILCRVARRVSRYPVLISSEHNVNIGAAWRTVAYRITDGLTDLTTNDSEAGVTSLIAARAAPASRVRFVPNGVNLLRFSKDDAVRSRLREELKVEARFVWLAIGRLEEQKDYPNLLAACKLISGHSARPVVLVAGDGPLRRQLEALADEIDSPGMVRFLGLRRDVQDLMSAADACVMSSRWEGMPVALLEAAASGLPIVATDVGGISQIVSDGVTGSLVPSADSAGLAAAMREMMEARPEALRELGNAAASHVRSRFELAAVVKEWETIYEALYAREATFTSNHGTSE